MADPALPSNITDQIRELQRRVERLEMSGRLTASSMTDGTVRFVDGNGVTRVVIGKDPTNPASFGLYVADENGQRVYEVDNTGLVWPRQRAVVSQGALNLPSTAASATAATSFTELLRADFDCTSPEMYVDFIARVTGTATGEFRVTVREAGATAVVVDGPFTTTGQRQATFTVPASALLSGTNPVGRYIIVTVEGRVTGGAGTVYAAPIDFRSPFAL